MIDEHGQSDGGIVPGKSSNKPKGAEKMEERPPVKGNVQRHPSPRTQSRTSGMQKVLERIREAVTTTAARQNLRQEPDAVIPHVRICEGGGP